MTTPKRTCPICRKARSEEHSPFCSKRCRDRDLLQWLDGGYALPGPPDLSSSDLAPFSGDQEED
ncbi:DNA gyrase inhibitor YacG [Novosphingobium mangrovi (ex Hu et al. 2023)]|uniref:DNA gyrase inhibitor YacG n=1 Tax=Novosphingobium mangrovi (ex Hu et al. 2023) TaxID=2930094 RepID=A0ABT0A9Z0_9SPHN|nr:DNA gyrase inhibitor YacG [Novosphingobium mangrovi (ex Hu et al. 2023)]MCJ1960016.1 DNA gyrase inhibitor YacG [Novosphingobium mangrovi (ex Hu et al. 2023)]